MTTWIVQLPLSVSLIIVIALSSVVPWLAVLLVRRIWPHPAFKENNELVGFTYSVYGLIYGVLLAFFIALTHLANGGERKRAEAVAGSLNSVFAGAGTPFAD